MRLEHGSVSVLCVSDGLPTALPLAPTLQPLGSSPRAVMDRLARLGFAAIELSIDQPAFHPRAFDASSRRGLLSVLRQRGLKLAGIDAFLPPQLFHDPAHVDQVVSTLTEAIDLAADLMPAAAAPGTLGVGVHFPSPEPAHGEEQETLSEAGENKNGHELSSVVAVIEKAAQRGVPLIDFRADGLWADRDLVMRGIDCLAVLRGGGDPVKAVHHAGDRLLSLRLADQHSDGTPRPLDGGAHGFDLLGLKVALSVNGYAAPVVVTSRGWADPWAGLIQTQQAWASHAG